jgi:hypothetical protein
VVDDRDSSLVRRAFRIGTQADVDWIRAGTSVGRTVTVAIPPVFEAYATVVVPDGDEGEGPRRRHDRAVLSLLGDRSGDQPWWLGYLDTGVDDVIVPGAARVLLYPGWAYVLLEAGSEQAATLRSGGRFFERSLPDLIFPADRSWLLSTLWDDDWRWLGGPADLIDSFSKHPDLETRIVRLGEDAIPPGHLAD